MTTLPEQERREQLFQYILESAHTDQVFPQNIYVLISINHTIIFLGGTCINFSVTGIVN